MGKFEQAQLVKKRYLMRFLKEVNVYHLMDYNFQFQDGMTKDAPYKHCKGLYHWLNAVTVDRSEGDYLSFKTYERAITCAFKWASTPQGHEFWSSTRVEWEMAANKLKEAIGSPL